MNAEKVYKAITEALENWHVDSAEYTVYSARLQKLLDECRAEIAEKTLDSSMKNTFSSVQKFASECKKNFYDSRPALAGAWITKNGQTAICDCYTLYVHEEKLDGLPMVKFDDSITPLKIHEIIKDDQNAFGELPEVNKLKAAVKLAKLNYTGKSKDFTHYVNLKTPDGLNIFVPTMQLIRDIEMTGSRKFKYYSHSDISPITIVGEKCFVMQAVVRVKPENKTSDFVFEHKIAA